LALVALEIQRQVLEQTEAIQYLAALHQLVAVVALVIQRLLL
jgi:hypothetical protein